MLGLPYRVIARTQRRGRAVVYLDQGASRATLLVMSEQDLEALESQFPLISGEAFAEARRRVLASGQSVLQAEGSAIYRVFPDGRREFVKEIEPPVPAVPGSVYILR